MTSMRLNALVPLLVFTGLMGNYSTAQAEGKPPTVVEVVQVQYQDYAKPIRTSGILSYKSQQTLSFKTAGPVQQLTVNEGDRVSSGQLLASLTLEEIHAQVDEAEARVAMARNNLNRFTKLHKNNVVSLEQFQSAETDLAVSESKLRIARFNLKYSSIKAPSKGLVLRKFVETNELVNAYQPVLLVADTDQGWVIRTGVTDEDIVRLKKGDKASIQFDAWPNEQFQGTISQLATLADDNTGTFEIEITLPDSQNKLRSGFVGKVAITPSEKKKVVLVPVESVIRIQNKRADVFIYESSTKRVQTREISLDFLEPGFIASSQGLIEQETLVTLGAGLLRNGEQVVLKPGKNLLTVGE